MSQFTKTAMDPFLARLKDGTLTKREFSAFSKSVPSSGRIRAVAQLLLKHAERFDTLEKVKQSERFFYLPDLDTLQISLDDLS